MGCAYSVPSKPAERCAAAGPDDLDFTSFDAEQPRSAGATRSTRRRQPRAASPAVRGDRMPDAGGAVDTKRVGEIVRRSLQSSTCNSARGLAATPRRPASAKPQRAGRNAHSVAHSTSSLQSMATDLTSSAFLNSIEFDIAERAEGPAADYSVNPLVFSGTLCDSGGSGASRGSSQHRAGDVSGASSVASRRVTATPTPRRAAFVRINDSRPAAFSCVDSTGATVESRLQNRSQVDTVTSWVDSNVCEHRMGCFDDPQCSARAPRPSSTRF
jgi:hypothetical protein